MGFSSSEKSPNNNGGWVIAGIPLRAPLKPIYTAVVAPVEGEFERKTTSQKSQDHHNDSSHSHDYYPTTPTSEGSRIPAKLPCPAPPRKRKTAPARCNGSKVYNGKREFFAAPPDLEAVFIRRHVGC